MRTQILYQDGHMTKFQNLSNSKVTCDSGNSFEDKRSRHSLLEFIHSFFH